MCQFKGEKNIMEKITKTYVEKLYGKISKGSFVGESLVNEVEKRNPMEIKNDDKIQGFRYFDVEYIVDDKKVYTGNKQKYSNWIFFGKRYSLEEIKKTYGDLFEYKELINDIELIGYKYVCLTQTLSIVPMDEGDLTYDEYIKDKKKDKEKIAKKMFDKLREHIGEEVTYTGWWYGKELEDTKVLEEVEDFSSASFSNMYIPFIGFGSAISKITSKDGKVLYSNPYIETSYDRRSDDAINESKRLMFGDRIVDLEIAEAEKRKKEAEEYEEKRNLEAKKSKFTLMKEGITLVKPETVDEWLEYANNNCNDYYSVGVVKAVVSMMKKFEEGIPFDEAEKQVYFKELGLTGYMVGVAAEALSHFAKNGEEYRIYWNKANGIDDPEEKGVVNPAILTKKIGIINNTTD
jgi:hypothetical protein